MLSFLGSAVWFTAALLLVGFNFEALAMYGLGALLVGMIAWSKFTEPPLAAAYAGDRPAFGPAVPHVGGAAAVSARSGPAEPMPGSAARPAEHG